MLCLFSWVPFVATNSMGLAAKSFMYLAAVQPVSSQYCSQLASDYVWRQLGWDDKRLSCFGQFTTQLSEVPPSTTSSSKCDKLATLTASWDQERQQYKAEIERLKALIDTTEEDKRRQEQAREFEQQEWEEQAEMEIQMLDALAQQRAKYERAREFQQQEHEAQQIELQDAVVEALAQQQANLEEACTAAYHAGYWAGHQAGNASASKRSNSYLSRAVSPKSEGFLCYTDSGSVGFALNARDPYAAEPSCKRWLFMG